jgi:5-formyltetrahydrofolate cyclo-ligase
MNKETLRKELSGKRDRLSQEDRQGKSEVIIRKLEALEVFKKARSLLAYHSFSSEVITSDHLSKWKETKNLYLPVLTNETDFEAHRFSELKENHFGIPEPVSQETAEELDLILVPGLGFDRKGGRLGMGKGYYDRFLKNYKDVLKIGLAFDEQVLESLPLNPYDESVDILITDKEVIRCQS